MSVIMTLSANGDAKKLEEQAASDPSTMQAILESAKAHGLIGHRFYGSADGQIMVVDEWPDPGSFQQFFEEATPEIQPIMQEVGASSEPRITFWRKLETHDDVGWES